jgi:membrane fusion protein (multidrug efflux system)
LRRALESNDQSSLASETIRALDKADMTSLSPILRCLLLPLLISGAFAQGGRNGRASPLQAELHQITRSPIRHEISTVGTLRANESVTLVSELSRRLVKIHFEEGSQITAGQLLFKLDDSDLVAELGEIETRLDLASINQKRAVDLLPRRAISQQEFDTSNAELEILKAQKSTQEVNISKTEIRAPFAGVVGVRQVSEGAFVSPASPLVSLQDVSRIKVDFPLPERYAQEVGRGQKFTFTVAGSDRNFEGEITVIEPAIDASSRSLLVRGLCTSPEGLRPGGFAEVRLTLNELSSGFMVPSQAIVPSPRGQGVYQIVNGKAELKPVEVGLRTDDQVQILRGVKEGDLVATTNLLRIRPGVEVISANP